jgi:hypothetical protein
MNCCTCGTPLPLGAANCPQCGTATPFYAAAMKVAPDDPTIASSFETVAPPPPPNPLVRGARDRWGTGSVA